MSRNHLIALILVLAPAAAAAGCGGGGEEGDADTETQQDADAGDDAGADGDAAGDAAPDTTPDTEPDGTADPDADTDLDADTDPDAPPPPGMWVTAYIATWNLYVSPGGEWGNMPAEEVDYGAFTHAILFAVSAESDGSLGGTGQWDNFNQARIDAAVPGAHAAGTPILFSVGGAGNYDGFAAAIRSGVRPTFISTLVSFMQDGGFDGIDIDMEPIQESDYDDYSAFITELSGALASLSTPLLTRPLITAAVGWEADLFAPIQDHFDQINIMTYDMSGAWPGWVTWHNSPVYNGGYTFPSTGGPVPCADLMVQDFIDAGVAPEKIGIGIDFYGYIWSGGSGTPAGGVTGPRQEYTSDPGVESNAPYTTIMADYYQPDRYHWDADPQAAYLSIDEAGSADDKFISYDDETTAQRKVEYVGAKGIGGMIIWEIGGGYRADEPAGQRDRLLQAVKTAAGL